METKTYVISYGLFLKLWGEDMVPTGIDCRLCDPRPGQTESTYKIDGLTKSPINVTWIVATTHKYSDDVVYVEPSVSMGPLQSVNIVDVPIDAKKQTILESAFRELIKQWHDESITAQSASANIESSLNALEDFRASRQEQRDQIVRDLEQEDDRGDESQPMA